MSIARNRHGQLLIGAVVATLMLVLLPGVARPESAAGTGSDVTAEEAMAQAETIGQPVAVTSEYTKTTQVFANPDGTFTAEIASGPVQVPSAESPTGWQDIDTTLSDTGSAIEPAATAADVDFSDGGDAELASIASGTRELSMDWTTELPAPSLSGDTATYSGVMPGVDLTLQARPQGFEQNLVVASAPSGPIVVQLPLDLKGLSATVDEAGQLVAVDPSGKPVVAADPARMWGAAIDPATDEPMLQALVDTRIVSTASGPRLEIAPDPAFFDQPGITYPVTIDPAPDLAVDKDTYVDSSQPGQYFRNDTLLKVGSPDGSTKTRSYLKFGVSSLWGKYINSATMKLYETFAPSCTATTVAVYEANSPGIQTDTTWNNQPGQGSKYADVTDAKGGGTGCPEGLLHFSTGGANGKTMTDLVQRWADGLDNNGVRVEAANETNSGAYKRFKSSESSNNVPVLSVNYSSYPAVPTNLGIGIDVEGLPAMVGTYAHPGGVVGQLIFTVYDANSQVVVDDAYGSMTQPSGSSTFPLESVLLPHGSYTVSARAFDGTLWSAASTTVPLPLYPASSTPDTPIGLTPEQGQTLEGAQQTLSGIFQDRDGDSGHLLFTIRNEYAQVVDVNGTPSSGSFSVEGSSLLDGTLGGFSSADVSLPPGTYTWTATATDGMALSSAPPAIPLTISAQSPQGVPVSVVADSDQETSVVFSQPLSAGFLSEELGGVTFSHLNITLETGERSLLIEATNTSVAEELDNLDSRYGEGQVTAMTLARSTEQSTFEFPATVEAYAEQADSFTVVPESAEDLTEPSPPDPVGYGPLAPTGERAYPGWAPVRGRVAAYKMAADRNFFVGLVASAPSGFDGGLLADDYAYEHDLKLYKEFQDCSDPHFWASRPATIAWTSLPNPYLDTDSMDDKCHWRDFTIGSYNPSHDWVAGSYYSAAIVAGAGNRPSSQYQLTAQKLRAVCTGSPWCVGTIPGLEDDSHLLVGKTYGVVPGCRLWWRRYSSQAC